MSTVIANLFVPGRPRTKGSLKPLHRRGTAGRPCHIGLTESHAESRPWMKKMTAALVAHGRQRHTFGTLGPYAGAVEVNTFFRFVPTVSVAQATAGQVWESHDTPWPTADDLGDEDKLRRAVLDALTQSHTLDDDALVVGGYNWKRWVRKGEESGVLIVVRTAPEPADVIMLEMVIQQAASHG